MVVERLDDKLAETRAASAEMIPADKRELMERATQELEKNVWQMGLAEGDEAPDFTLPIARQGGTVTLSAVLREGPAVLSFYRGQW